VSEPAFKLPVLPQRTPSDPGLAPKRRYMMLGADCAACPLKYHRPVATQWAPPRIAGGDALPPVMALVGEAPGRREVQVGVPFSGPSGKVLNYACAQGGVDRKRIAVLNAIACGPIPSDNEAVKRAAMNACRPRLITELRALRPSVVMAMGGVALRSLAPKDSSGVTALRGAKLDVAEDIPAPSWRPRALFSTFHPAHVMRGGDGEADTDNKSVDALYYFILFDLAKTWRYAHGEAVEWAVEGDLFADVDGRLRRIEVDHNVPQIVGEAQPKELYDALGRVYDEAREHGEMTCDVETDNKDSLDANLTAIAYATPAGGVSATWGAWRLFGAVERLLAEIHGDRKLAWLWQNGIYDRVVLRRHKVLVGERHVSLAINGLRQEDTLLMHHAAFPGLPHRLDSIATQFHVVVPWKNEFRTSTRDTADLIWYNLNDAVMQARLGPAIRKHVKQAKTERVYEADRQLNVVATDMRHYGCYVDRGEQARHRATQTARLEYMKEQITAAFTAIEEPWRQALARLMADKQRKKDPDSYLARVELRYQEIAERTRKVTDIGMFKTKAKLDIVALFNVLKIPVKAFTKSGLPVTDKKAMEGAAARHPLMRSLIHIREAQHMIANFVDIKVRDNGRFHIDWKTNKITGRWGGQFMNVPNNVSSWPPQKDEQGVFRINKHGDYVCKRDNLRSIIAAPTAEQVLEIAARDKRLVHPLVLARAKQGHGRMLVGADEDQVELRIVGFLSREPFLLDIFSNGLDPHSKFSRDVIFPVEFPKLEATIKEANFKPKQLDLVEEQIKALGTRDDDLANVQRRKLEDVLRAMAGWKRLRDLAKRIEYGSLYRGEAPTLWESVVKDFPDLQLADVENMLNKVHEAMPRVVAWWNECDTYARQHREIRETWLNRVRFFPLGNFEPSIAVNFPVQARNAGLMATATFRFVALTRPELLDFEGLYRHRLLDAAWVNARRDEGFAKWRAPVNLILQIHDSLTAETDDEDTEKAAKLMTMCMDQTDVNERYGITMRYTGESKISRRWSKT